VKGKFCYRNILEISIHWPMCMDFLDSILLHLFVKVIGQWCGLFLDRKSYTNV